MTNNNLPYLKNILKQGLRTDFISKIARIERNIIRKTDY